MAMDCSFRCERFNVRAASAVMSNTENTRDPLPGQDRRIVPGGRLRARWPPRRPHCQACDHRVGAEPVATSVVQTRCTGCAEPVMQRPNPYPAASGDTAVAVTIPVFLRKPASVFLLHAAAHQPGARHAWKPSACGYTLRPKAGWTCAFSALPAEWGSDGISRGRTATLPWQV